MTMHPLSDEALLDGVRRQQSTMYRLDVFADSLIMDLLVSSKLSQVGTRRLSTRTATMNEPYVQKRAAQPFKRYEGARQIALADYPPVELSKGLSRLAADRRSTKGYSGDRLSLLHLATLLGGSYGVSRIELLHESRVPWKFRPIPSPGGLFASEIYVLLINSDISPGLYHYRPDIHALEEIKLGRYEEFVTRSCGVDRYIDSAQTICGVVMTTSIIERLYIKYGERSYKFMMIETGILAQQLSLVAESLDLGSCMLGGYFDDDLHDFIGIDGVLESVQNVMVIGHKQTGG